MRKQVLALAMSAAVLGGAVVATESATAATPRSPYSRVVVPTPGLSTGPRAWVGPRLVHPSPWKRFYPQVTRWGYLTLAIMREHKIPDRYLPGILAQIQQESGGNPNAINLWDSNAAKGTPSKGLLQVIWPTYRFYAKPGLAYPRLQTVPYANLWAALNYVVHRYGHGKFLLWNRGYNQGY